jgi:ATP-binding cassette subfamily C protein
MGMIFLNALLQLLGVTSVFPFFALASEPDRLHRSKFGRWLLHFLPPLDNNHLMVVFGIFTIVMLVLASIGSMVSEVIRIRYAYGFSQWLRRRLLDYYAVQPYSYFLVRNSAELSQKVNDIQNFISGVLLPVGEILTRIVLVFLLIAAVFLVHPMIALGVTVLLGGFYLIAFIWLRPKAKIIGEKLLFHSVQSTKNLNQFLYGIKTILVHEKTSQFTEKALEHAFQVGEYQSKIPIYSNGPRYLIEPIAFGGLVGVVVVMALQGRPFSDILPNLAVMAFAGIRLLPALQLLYSQLVSVASNSYTLGQLEEEILSIELETELRKPHVDQNQPLEFHDRITLENISFRYADHTPDILKDFNVVILKNQSLGIIGPSGSGKSTLVDILLGLHHPISGRVVVDEKPITPENIASWRAMIGYVPQDIHLLDETIEANIAFGIDELKIDQVALREAAQGAQILEFIEDLPDGFKTTVGERGVRLSGGQRQRIGLARALYHGPEILILDEATSALDNETEEAVMETINRLQGSLTMVTIAHRLSTIERCDRIIEIRK